jgi:hypothetical protein
MMWQNYRRFPSNRSDVFAQTEIKGMPHLPFGRLGAVLDLGEKLRFHPYAAMGDPLGVRLCLADKRRQMLAQIGGRPGIEAVVDLAGIDKVPALAAGQIDAVPFSTVEGKAGDGQRLTLLAVFLTQMLPRPET